MAMFCEIVAAGMELHWVSRLEPSREGKCIKPVFWLALILDSQGKKTTRQTLFGLLRDRGCDVESLPAVTTEGAVCNISHGHLDDAINCSVWRHTHDACATKTTVPEITFRIDCRTIRRSPRKVLQEWFPVADTSSIRMVVVFPYDVGQRISEIEMAPVGALRQGVRDADTGSMFRYRTVRIQAIKNAIFPACFSAGSIRCYIVAHRTDPERTARIRASVIKADPWPTA